MAELKRYRVLGIDPGKSTGYAVIDLIDNRIRATEFVGIDPDGKINKIKKLLDTQEVDMVIYENFRLRPHMARRGAFDRSEMIASKVIGKIEDACEERNIKCVKQEASDKPAGYALAGMKYVPGKKGLHWQDALAHAVLFCVRHFGSTPLASDK